MSSDEDKCSLHVAHNDSDRSVSTDLQEEYEELLRYAIVNPNVECSASQPSHLRGEVAPDRFPTLAGSPRKPSHPVMDFFSSHVLDDSSSPASLSTRTDAHEINGGSISSLMKIFRSWRIYLISGVQVLRRTFCLS